MVETQSADRMLIARAAGRLCAFRLSSVLETMRPLSVMAFPDAPSFVLGTAIIRGLPTPVVDCAVLLGVQGQGDKIGRFITLKVSEKRVVALGVEAVIGIRNPSELPNDLPPLLQSARSEVIKTISALDERLLVTLSEACLLPEEVWVALESTAANA